MIYVYRLMTVELKKIKIKITKKKKEGKFDKEVITLIPKCSSGCPEMQCLGLRILNCLGWFEGIVGFVLNVRIFYSGSTIESGIVLNPHFNIELGDSTFC